MGSIGNRLGVAGMFLLVAMTGWAQLPVKPATEAKAADEKDKAAPGPAEGLKGLPPGAIIVICDDLKSAKKLNPKLILLTPKQYQDLRDESDRAKVSAPSDDAVPAECRLVGQVDGDVVHVHAEF